MATNATVNPITPDLASILSMNSPPRPRSKKSTVWIHKRSSSCNCPISCGVRFHRGRSGFPPHGTLRVFPGEGLHSVQVADFVTRLSKLGYSGDYSFEVFNDDYQQMRSEEVAERARLSSNCLAEEVLRRAVPLPGQFRLKMQASTIPERLR